MDADDGDIFLNFLHEVKALIPYPQGGIIVTPHFPYKENEAKKSYVYRFNFMLRCQLPSSA